MHKSQCREPASITGDGIRALENLAEKSGCVDVNHTHTPPSSRVPLLGEPKQRCPRNYKPKKHGGLINRNKLEVLGGSC